MLKKITKFIFIVAICTLGLISCKDEDLFIQDEIPNVFEGGSAITLSVTLDAMGGTRADALSLSQIENYVDPQKFRVLFFDNDENFLFESKSRWVKKVEDATGIFNEYTKWNVSVPFFSYGNDTEENWDWEQIKEALTYDKNEVKNGDELPIFKIAILANRPQNDWYPGFERTKSAHDPKWFDNSGPHWKRENSIAYKRYYDSLSAEERAEQNLKAPDVKKILNLHHAQVDPIYYGKNFTSSGDTKLYNIIADKVNTPADVFDVEQLQDYELYLGSTSSWVDWGEMDTGNRISGILPKVPDLTKFPNMDRNNGGFGIREEEIDMGLWGWRHSRLPDENYPIPMYGVQNFTVIEKDEWEDGTTYNLNNENDPISLLRSVARLELAFPAEYEVMFMSIFYPNVYGRCEPSDVWTPTDELWEERHEGGQCKDEESIVQFGPMSSYDTSRGDGGWASGDRVVNSEDAYWPKLAWIYGHWFDKGWTFGDNWNNGGNWQGAPSNRAGSNWFKTNVQAKVNNGTYPDYPRIFNPCVQRNNVLHIPDNQDFGIGEHRYVVYLPERSPNDPSDLNNVASAGSGKPTVMYWSFELRHKTTGISARYSVALGDYDNKYGNGSELAAWLDDPSSQYDGRGVNYAVTSDTDYKVPENNMGQTSGNDSHGSGFMRNYQINGKPSPLPILRNHVYKIRLQPASGSQGKSVKASMRSFKVTSEVKESPTINFSGKKRQKALKTSAESIKAKEAIIRK